MMLLRLKIRSKAKTVVPEDRRTTEAPRQTAAQQKIPLSAGTNMVGPPNPPKQRSTGYTVVPEDRRTTDAQQKIRKSVLFQEDIEFLSSLMPSLTTLLPVNTSTAAAGSPSLGPNTNISQTSTSGPQMPSSPVSKDHVNHYRDLKNSEIRLIRLLPMAEATLRCEIVYETICQHSDYIALSYAWGNADDTTEIQLNGCAFQVTASLHSALEALYKKRGEILLWADALSINQSNAKERSQQVRIMGEIYKQAKSVVVWLGKEGDGSTEAIKLIDRVANISKDGGKLKQLIGDEKKPEFDALVALFERPYWNRLWVVQEILLPSSVDVYCGDDDRKWATYIAASEAFRQYSEEGGIITGTRKTSSKHHLSYDFVLSSTGPNSVDSLRKWQEGNPGSLLEMLHNCRRKLTGEPRDKLFGVLGILPKEVRDNFEPDYNAPLRHVYTNIVAYLLRETHDFGVVCEAIHFPLHTSNVYLPSWVPDWSYIPQAGALCLSFSFSASFNNARGTWTEVEYSFRDHERKLQISAIDLGKVTRRGIAVGTLCKLEDSLMAFLHWRAQLLQHIETYDTNIAEEQHEAFCRTLRIGQSTGWTDTEWVKVCYYLFGSFIRERLPHINLDPDLQRYVDVPEEQAPVKTNDRRRILDDACCHRMMSRCFFITEEGLMGMGTGFMDEGDRVCVPFGSRTPVLLRQEGNDEEYRFVGDAYVDGYMDGKAIEEWQSEKRESVEYVLH